MAGTVAADVSLLVRAIVMGWPAGLAIETVPVVASAPAASLTVCWARVEASVGIFSSTTTALSEPVTNPVEVAVIVVVMLPSIWPSLTTVTGNVAEVCAGRDRHGGRDRELVDVVAEQRNHQRRGSGGVAGDGARRGRIGGGLVDRVAVQRQRQRGHVDVRDGERVAAGDPVPSPRP